MLWIVLASIIVGLLLLDLFVRLYFARLMLREFESKLTTVQSNPGQRDHSAEPLEFTTSDGLTLRGSLHGNVDRSPRGLILFCPELNGNHWSAAEYCRGPLDAGFLVLSFDFRNQGESDFLPDYDPLHWLTSYEVCDVRAALAFARSRADLRELPMGLVGVSRGGGAALAAAALEPSVKAVAVEGAFSTVSLQLLYSIRRATMYVPGWLLKVVPEWHLKCTMAVCRWMSQRRRKCRYTNLEGLLPRLSDRPVLLIAGCQDNYVPIDVPETIAGQIDGDECQLWKVEHARHNRARHMDERAYDQRLSAFFRHNLELLSDGDYADFETAEDSAHDYERQPEHQPTAS